MQQSKSITSEGADLVFDTQGSGSALLLIPGAGGNSLVYSQLAGILADQYTVITYDRRCNGRSSGDVTADLDMAQQARDAVAVLEAAKQDRAIVFGNSGGGSIALKLATDHPSRVAGLVVHEPPVISLLPDREELFAFMDQVHSTFVQQGVPVAMQLFASRLVGFTGPVPGGTGDRKDLVYFLAKEYRNLTSFAPELAMIKASHLPTAVLVGARSEGAYYARATFMVAEHLGCACITVPGNHLAFLTDPQPFALALRGVLAGLPNS